MSFHHVKASKPELDRLKKHHQISMKGKELLKIKEEQLRVRLKSVITSFFSLRTQMRDNLLENMKLLGRAYEVLGKRRVKRIAFLNSALIKPEVSITYIHSMGFDIPKIELNFPTHHLPSYSYSDTALVIDILIRRIRQNHQILIEIAKTDHLLYQIAENLKRVAHRIDALDDIILPQLEANIRSIEDILSDDQREEFIRLKEIKKRLEGTQTTSL